jgi:hypothetical protein
MISAPSARNVRSQSLVLRLIWAHRQTDRESQLTAHVWHEQKESPWLADGADVTVTHRPQGSSRG